MQYVEAFNKLGYEVPNPRQDWSAEKVDSICITLWKLEVEWTPPPPSFSCWKKWQPGDNDWTMLPGNKKRSLHIQRAIAEFERWVDVIIVNGAPQDRYGSADVWSPAQRLNHRWRIQEFDAATGFFSATAEKLQ